MSRCFRCTNCRWWSCRGCNDKRLWQRVLIFMFCSRDIWTCSGRRARYRSTAWEIGHSWGCDSCCIFCKKSRAGSSYWSYNRLDSRIFLPVWIRMICRWVYSWLVWGLSSRSHPHAWYRRSRWVAITSLDSHASISFIYSSFSS